MEGANSKRNLKEAGLKGVDWIHLAQDMGQWLTFMNTVLNPRVRLNVEKLLVTREGLSSVESVG
jgi:hypothetical protein